MLSLWLFHTHAHMQEDKNTNYDTRWDHIFHPTPSTDHQGIQLFNLLFSVLIIIVLQLGILVRYIHMDIVRYNQSNNSVSGSHIL